MIVGNFSGRFKSATALLLTMAAAGIFACSSGGREQNKAKRTFTDDLGRKVEVANVVDRAISLAPSVTESVFAAGAGRKLVGVTTYCNYPPEARQIARVGDTQAPSIETIVALRPDLVLISTASQLQGTLPQIERQNIPVFVADPKNLEQIAQNLRTFGQMFSTEAIADQAAQQLESAKQLVVEKVRDLPRPRVFVQISREPLFTVGADSYLIDVVEKAGGEVVTKQIPTAYPKISRETAVSLQPDVIILSTSEDNGEPNDVFRDSPAVKAGRVYRFDADILSRPGPRLILALADIAKALHPGIEI